VNITVVLGLILTVNKLTAQSVDQLKMVIGMHTTQYELWS